MSAWERLLELTASSPFTGTWMSLGTALGALIAVLVLRRLLPRDDRGHGSTTAVLLSVGLLLGLVRLFFAVTGAHASTIGKVVNVLTTFFVSLGAVNALVLFVFEVVPARTQLRLPIILREVIQMLAFVVVVFGSISQTGLHDIASLITTSAVLTAVVGLALQSTISNLFAGIVLNMDRTLSVGDWVQVGQRTGRIAQIRWRSTVLRTRDGNTVIIPNGQFTAQEVYNYSRPNPRFRIEVRVGFHYRHPPNEVRDVLVTAAASAPGVLADPRPECFPVDFSDSAVAYTVRFWIDTFERQAPIEGEVRTRIWYAAARAGLEIPYPMRTLHMLNASAAPASHDAVADVDRRLQALERVDLFAGLAPTERELLAQGMRRDHFAAGEQIIRQGAPGDSLFLIAQGEVLVSLGQDGINQSVTTLKAGDFFGEMSLMTGEPRSATCTARVDTICYVIDHATFHRLLTQRPQIAEHMSTLLTARQATLDRKGGELSARAALATDGKVKMLERIRRFFELQ
jgi:small-conductance mechanosensitive channel/CRP-like cAMP-binding protein